jgi:hypothetical protein
MFLQVSVEGKHWISLSCGWCENTAVSAFLELGFYWLQQARLALSHLPNLLREQENVAS